MTLLTHEEIKARRLFSQPSPPHLHIKATSVDLTIGVIIDCRGNKHYEGYTLEPGEMVQVISLERFSLPSTVTALVSYKTAMTRKGVWALTVGLVDPGWDGYVSTTLLNFSKVSVRLYAGQEFLRSSFFEHGVVDKKFHRSGGNKAEYVNGIISGATTDFPPKFLDQDKIAERAGEHASEKMRNSAVKWAAGIALVFSLVQIILTIGPLEWDKHFGTQKEMMILLQQHNDNLQKQIDELRGAISTGGE